MSPIALLDLTSLLLALASLTLALSARRGVLSELRWIVVLLLAVTSFDSVSNVLEWSRVTAALDPYEDYAQVAVPLLFLFAFHGMLQAASRVELGRGARRLQEAQALAKVGSFELAVVEGGASWSPELFRIHGLDPGSERVSREWLLEWVVAEQRERVAAALSRALDSDEPVEIEYRIEPRGGPARVLRAVLRRRAGESGEGFSLAGAVMDITDLRRAEAQKTSLEEQLVEAQRLEAIGRLAGGVAHDFNNLLTVIRGSVALALRRGGHDERVVSLLETCDEAAERGGQLTRQLLAFGRRQVVEPRAVDVNQTIAGLKGMLERLISEDISLELLLAAELPAVRVDPTLFEQVLVNLVANSRDAMPDGGAITISTSLQEQALEGAAGPTVAVVVSDDGVGMSPEVMAHVFEPFFTTKPKERGSGLGLASAYGAVVQSGGRMTVQSSPGGGARFSVLLPAHLGGAQARPGERASREEGARHGEVILVVEDDDAVRRVVCEGLERLGYRVHEASDPTVALADLDGIDGEVDLLISDVVMPQMNGAELAAEVVRRRPGTLVLFISGHTEDVLGKRGVLEPGTHLLHKPFRPADLAQRVRDLLDDRASSRPRR